MVDFMSFKARVRRFLGPRLSNAVRNSLVSARAFLGLLPRVNRPDCVSALMRVRDEEWWIEPSILSIKDLVNEYVIMDASTDRTPEIIEGLRRDYGLNIIHVMDFDDDIARVSQRGLEMIRCRWVLRWDGDFVMTEYGVQFIKDLINRLRRDRYYAIYWPHILLVGDPFHQDPNAPLHSEHWLVTYTPGMRFIRIPGGFEYLYVPTTLAYRIEIDKPLSFHVDAKPKVRLLSRKYRWEHFVKGVNEPLMDYIKRRVEEDYGTDDLNKAAEIYYQELISKLVPYDKNKYGDYPEILKRYIEKYFEKSWVNLQ